MSKATCFRYSRRAALRVGLAAATSSLLPEWSLGADAAAVDENFKKLPLITRRVLSTGERIPAIGIGTNAFSAAKYPEIRAVLQRMQEMGGSVIDTSDDYPNPSSDEAEDVIGSVLSDLNIRRKMFITTKFNAEGFQPSNVPRDIVFGQDAFDRSLQRLRTDRIDLQYVHHLPSIDPLMPLLQKLKKSGKARYIGISALHPDEHEVIVEKMHQYPIDFVEVNYSLGSRDAESTVLKAAMELKIAVMVDVPLGGRRGPLLKEVGDRPLPPWAADIDVSSWGQFFLKYVISHPAVTCAIPGATKVEHVVDDQLAGRGRLPDAAMRKKMEQLWDSIMAASGEPKPNY
jgi:aryl-alcohol dehydrogenase-like predicted oxidoreductase